MNCARTLKYFRFIRKATRQTTTTTTKTLLSPAQQREQYFSASWNHLNSWKWRDSTNYRFFFSISWYWCLSKRKSFKSTSPSPILSHPSRESTKLTIPREPVTFEHSLKAIKTNGNVWNSMLCDVNTLNCYDRPILLKLLGKWMISIIIIIDDEHMWNENKPETKMDRNKHCNYFEAFSRPSI